MFKKYLIYSSIFSLFTEKLLIHNIIDIKFFYIIIILNSGLLIYYGLYYFNKVFLLILGIIFTLNFFNILLGINQWYLFSLQFLGITIIASYYYNFFRYLDDNFYVFDIYVKTSFWIASLGLTLYLIDVIYHGEVAGLDSIMLEPAHYAAVVLPAFYFSLWNYINYKSYKKETAILLLSIILSGSAVAFIGLLLTIFFIGKKSIFKIFQTLLAVILVGFIMYTTNSDVGMRVDDTLMALYTMDLKGANLSTTVLLSNAYISYNSFMSYPIFGSGLGSYILAYQEYFYKIDGGGASNVAYGINSKDANSLFLRLLVESGMFGIILLSSFIIRNGVGLGFKSEAISKGLLIYIMLKLLREGHYFPPEMWFFFMLYLFLKRKSNVSKI